MLYSPSSHVLVLTREVDTDDTFLDEESVWKKASYHHSTWTSEGFVPLMELAQSFEDYSLVKLDYQFGKFHVNVATTHLKTSEEYIIKKGELNSIGINALILQ